MDVKNSDPLPRNSILPKKKTPVPGLVRARFSKARPNIRPLASKPVVDVPLKQENSKTTKYEDTCKGPTSNLPLNISLEEKREQDLTPSVKNLNVSLSKTTPHENACSDPSSNLPLNISPEEKNEQDSTPRVKNIENVLLSSKTTQNKNACKDSSSNLPLNISPEEQNDQDPAPSAKNVVDVLLSSKTTQHEDICKGPLANLSLNVSLEEKNEQNSSSMGVKNLDPLPQNSILPKKKTPVPGLVRARFSKARPNIRPLASKPVVDAPLKQENSKTTQNEDACKGSSSKLPLSISTDSNHKEDSTPRVKNVEDVSLSKTTQHEDICKGPLANLSLNVSLENENEQNSSPMDVKNSDPLPQNSILPKKKTPVPSLVRARFSKARPNISPLASKPVVDAPLKQENSKTTKHEDTCKDPTSNLPLNISPEEENEQNSTTSVENLKDVPVSNQTKQHEGTCKGASSNLSLETFLEKEHGQGLTPCVNNLEDIPLSRKTKQHGDACKSSSSNLTSNVTLENIHELDSTASVKNAEDMPFGSKRHYEAAFEKEILSAIHETPDCSAENAAPHSNKFTSEKTAKPRKKFANACLTSPAIERDANYDPDLNSFNAGIAVHDSTIEACIDDPPVCGNDEDITDLCSDNHHEVTMDEEDPPAVLNDTESVPSKKVSKSSRKRVASKKPRERKKRAYKAKEAPPRSEMTMVDLINYIPDGAPMKYKESQTNVEEEVRPNETSVPVEEKEDNSSGPRVVIGENGEIMIDEASLVVRRKENEYESSSAVVENDNTTYSSFRKLITNKWTLRETMKFYQALVLVGTDFALMELVFKNNWKIAKSRHELKLKFKREERHNAKFVYRAMYESNTWDISILQDNADDISDSSEVDEPSINENETQSDKVEKKQKDTVEEIAVDHDPMVV